MDSHQTHHLCIDRDEPLARGARVEKEVARRVEQEWRAGYLAMAADLRRRPHQSFYDVASPTKARRPWSGIQNGVERVVDAGGTLQTVRTALHQTIDRVCDLLEGEARTVRRATPRERERGVLAHIAPNDSPDPSPCAPARRAA